LVWTTDAFTIVTDATTDDRDLKSHDSHVELGQAHPFLPRSKQVTLQNRIGTIN
jgi:hypothetical protein